MTRHDDLVQALLQARRAGTRLDAGRWAGTLATPADAYAVQDALTHALDGPAPPRAWKSGGPSRSQALTHAALPVAGLLADGASAAHLPLAMRAVEAEIALRLGRAVAPADAARMTPATAADWVDAMAPAIELVDTRWEQGVQVEPLLKLADHQAHAALVVGRFVPWRAADWARQACHVRIGTQARSFTGSHSLGDPAWLLPLWLRHATRDGAVVPAGTVVTTGTWCGLLHAAAGEQVSAAFDGIGEVALRF